MLVRIKSDFKTPRGSLKAGDIVSVKPRVAHAWCAAGRAAYLKTITPGEVKYAG